MSPRAEFVLTTRFRDLFRISADSPELMHSQLKALGKQVPLLYFILVTNSLAVAYTHFDFAPKSLTMAIPAVLAVVCIARLAKWLRTRNEILSDASAFRRLRRTVIMAVVFGAIYISWGLALYPYGNPYTQGHVAFFTGITVVSCIFCLMHLRPAALLLTGVVITPFTIFFLHTGRPVFIAIACNLLLVSAAMVYVLLIYSRDFAKMIAFQKELVEKHLETQRLSDENSRLANRDALTDLPNRRQFFTNLRNMLDLASTDEKRFVVGLIDLDGFKPVNDVYGHMIGDKVLVETGARLREASEEKIFLARLGGDEFGVLIDADLSDTEIHSLGEKLCVILQMPFHLPGIIAQIGGSVGFATFPEAGTTIENLYERADYALYHAKQHMRGRPVIFSKEHETEIRQFGLLDQNLRHADLEAELSLNFQPLFDVERGKPAAFEALARWDSAELGRVPPDVFIRVAERSDLINKMSCILLNKALASALAWPPDIRISFNLSIRDLASSEAIGAIVDIIEKSGVAPERIDFEVTETALMRDFDQSNDALRALKALGCQISLDDFGTGYSSLSYLHRLPLDKIKIDRSFIMEIETEATSRNIVKAVIDLCRNLDLTCVIEGTETYGQARILQDFGCTMMQGYYFGKPMPGDAVLEFLDMHDREADYDRAAAVA